MRKPQAITDLTIKEAQTAREGAAMTRKLAISRLVGAMLVTLAAACCRRPDSMIGPGDITSFSGCGLLQDQ